MKVFSRFGLLLFASLVVVGNGVAPGLAQTPSAAKPMAEPARDLLLKALLGYQKLNSFSMTIRNQDTSGLFPGAYTQELKWRRGNRFTLKVVSPGNARVPDYYADGARVISDTPDGERLIAHVTPDKDTSPGWEVSGGLIMSFLQKTEMIRYMTGETPLPAPVSVRFGPRTKWRGMTVREIVVKSASAEKKEEAGAYYLDKTGKRLLGGELPAVNNKKGYFVYTDQRFNPPLPATLGNASPSKTPPADSKPTQAAPLPTGPLLAAGTPAPDFAIQDKNGKPVKLSGFAGKVVVVDFWATWCGPCEASLPHTNKVAGQFKGDVVVLAVSTWDQKKDFLQWIESNRPKYPNLTFAFDPNQREGNVATTLYNVTLIPTQYIIGRDGKVVTVLSGYGGETDKLRDALKSALSGSVAVTPNAATPDKAP